MHRPGALLFRSGRWPARNVTNFQSPCPIRRWYSTNWSIETASKGAESAEATATSESDFDDGPIPRPVLSSSRGYTKSPYNKAGFQVDTGPPPKTRQDFSSVEEWNEEHARLTFKGAIKDIGPSQALVRLPWTKKTREKLRVMNLYYIQLRDACHCHLCVDPKTKQRYFRSSDIPTKIRPRRMVWHDDSFLDEEKVLEIQWENDIPGYDSSHVTRFTADELRFPSRYHFSREADLRPRLYWKKADMDKAQHWVSYKDYMKNDAIFGQALKALSRYGLIFIKDIPDSREMVEKIATRIGPLRNSFYGSTWDVRNDPQAKNVAYTNQNLGFHMDLLYMANPPGFQLLHCLKNSCKGGESLFVDAFSAARDLDTLSWNSLSRFPVPYHYDHDDHYYNTSRPVIETVDNNKSPDGSVQRRIAHINYSPPFQGPFWIGAENTKRWGARAEAFISAFKIFADKIEEPERIFELKLNPGECVIFENRRVLHARRAFDTTSGERWLAGAYIDEDAVNSKMFTFKRKAGAFKANNWEFEI